MSSLRRIDYGKDETSGHGLRAMARTILDEVRNVRPTLSRTNWLMPFGFLAGEHTIATHTYPNAKP